MIRERYGIVIRAIFVISAAMVAGCGVFTGYGVLDLYYSDESILEVIALALTTVLTFVGSLVLWHLHLELQISEKQIAVRAWPSPWTKISIDQVLTSEVVEIDPFKDYGGWGIKGSEQDRLIGGRGTTALRITYTHESGGQRKLSFLTDRAEEANRRIASELKR